MTHVIAGPCLGLGCGACVLICPIDCIHPVPAGGQARAPQPLVIDPEVCIDCGLCVYECPVGAIYADEDLPDPP